MTALMWSCYKTSSIDPTRLLVTLGASLTMVDSIQVIAVVILCDLLGPQSVLWSRSRPVPLFLAGAVKKGAAPAPALQLKLQL